MEISLLTYHSGVLGYPIGREIFPNEVSLTNQAHVGKNEYVGTYFQLSGGGDPVEAWIDRRLDSLMIYEKEMYRTVKPVGYSSWPTLDPLTQPTEQSIPDSQEDDEMIDLAGRVIIREPLVANSTRINIDNVESGV